MPRRVIAASWPAIQPNFNEDQEVSLRFGLSFAVFLQFILPKLAFGEVSFERRGLISQYGVVVNPSYRRLVKLYILGG